MGVVVDWFGKFHVVDGGLLFFDEIGELLFNF